MKDSGSTYIILISLYLELSHVLVLGGRDYTLVKYLTINIPALVTRCDEARYIYN